MPMKAVKRFGSAMIAVTAPYSHCKSRKNKYTHRISAKDALYKGGRDTVIYFSTTNNHSVCTSTYGTLKELLEWDLAKATLRLSHCPLIKTPRDSVHFVHAKSMCHHSAFNAIPTRLLAMLLRCCDDACNHTARILAFCIFLGQCGNAMRTQP